jgi:hypothetical protein
MDGFQPVVPEDGTHHQVIGIPESELSLISAKSAKPAQISRLSICEAQSRRFSAGRLAEVVANGTASRSSWRHRRRGSCPVSTTCRFHPGEIAVAAQKITARQDPLESSQLRPAAPFQTLECQTIVHVLRDATRCGGIALSKCAGFGGPDGCSANSCGAESFGAESISGASP